jgi:capsular exopolysaccharide synthesis family protein
MGFHFNHFNKKKSNQIKKASSSMLYTNMPKEIAFFASEAYKTIRTNLLFSFSKSSDRVVLVTSSEPGAGKSVTTANLAITMAQTNARVLIIDADMRKPRQHKVFGVSNANGLSKLLSGLSGLDNTSLFCNVAENVDLIPAGPTPPNPAELLVSPTMGQLIKELSSVYDYILIDTAPVGAVSDALSLLSFVQNTVIVARHAQTPYPDIKKSISSITSLGGSVLGVVLTDTTRRNRTYNYGSKYYKYSKYNYHNYYYNG